MLNDIRAYMLGFNSTDTNQEASAERILFGSNRPIKFQRETVLDYSPIRVSDLVRKVNKDLYLPAIQRELVWKTDRIERLFDSIMGDFPIGGFLFWNLEYANRDQWPIYEFIQDFREDSPHNPLANLSGIVKDTQLVIDGQQRITALYIGLGGSYRFFYYRWRDTKLYLDLLKQPEQNEENPEELSYGFMFRENAEPQNGAQQIWYPVGRILDFNDAEDAKIDMTNILAPFSEEQKVCANRLIGRLHNRIHTTTVGNYYLENSQDYDKVLQVFIRANSGGVQLEYSDLLLATATAKWQRTDARKEIYEFTDAINGIGNGFTFRKDFVLKSCLYLTDLPVQYQVKNFTASNLQLIENNWDTIKLFLTLTVRLISKFGFHHKNVVAPLGLLPIAYYLMKRDQLNFDDSSDSNDTNEQESIRKWFVISTLKNAFGGASDTTLSNLRKVLGKCGPDDAFPVKELYSSLEIEASFNAEELDRMLEYKYQGRYTNLILSLLYPDKHWKDVDLHVDHIYPYSRFSIRSLKEYGYDAGTIEQYSISCDTLCNLQILTRSENQEKSDRPFDEWIESRDNAFRSRHLIPEMESFHFGDYLHFVKCRKDKIVSVLSSL